jgi:hypothetical protein
LKCELFEVDAGATAGNFQDANNVLHGFLRAPGGVIVAFDAPGAGTGAFQGTQVFAINSEGTVVGITIDAGYARHGMLRARDGLISMLQREARRKVVHPSE